MWGLWELVLWVLTVSRLWHARTHDGGQTTVSRFVFYNAGPRSRTRRLDASRDWAALLREFRPRVGVGCEVVGDPLDPVPGWGMARDRRRASRDNMVGWVRDDCQWRRTWWIDHRTTWGRTNPGAVGQHPPRSTLVLGVGQVQVLGGHNVPLGTDATAAGQLEIVNALNLVMAPWKFPRVRDRAPEADLDRMRARPRILLWDDNAPTDDDAPDGERGMGSDYLASRIGGTRHGARIDNCVVRHVPVEGVEYVTHAGGRKLATDHPFGALVVHVTKGALTWVL